MKDTIYRSDAIEAVRKIVPVETAIDATLLDKAEVIVLLSALPSAEAVSREVYEKRTQSDEQIIDSYRREFAEAASAEAVQGDGRNNIKRYPNCQMRTSLGNCDAIGGFCTSINAPICDAFHKLTEAVQGWIPCSERLPDTDIYVLVSDGVYVWVDELQEDYEDGKNIYWWDSQCSFDFNDTAWMPLPEPYKGGEDE